MSKIIKWGSSTALRNLNRRKVRAALSILGISISVLTITTIISLGLGMQAEVETFVGDVLGGSIILRNEQTSLTPSIPEYVVGIIDDIPGVEKTIPSIMAPTRLGDQLIFLIGVDPELIGEIFQISFSEGGMLGENDNDKITLLGTTADSLGLHVNDTIYLSNSFSDNGVIFQISGIMESMGSGNRRTEAMGGMTESSSLGGAGFSTFNAAQNLVESDGYVSMIYVQVDDIEQIDEIESIIETLFVDAKIIKQDSILESASDILDLVNAVLLALSGISLIVGSLGVMNTILVSVHERRTEIGVLKAIGAERSHILFMFIMEAIYMGLLGGLFGSLLGTGGITLLNAISQRYWDFTIPILLTWETYAKGMAVALIISVLAGIYPSWSAANIKPVEAMRSE